MPIDVTKYINRSPNRSLEDEHEDPTNPEGDTGDDEDPVDHEDAVEDEEGLADSSPNFSESDVEDSRDPGTSSPEQGAGRESSVPDDPKMNEAETDSDLEQLLIDTGPQRLEDLTTATESVRTTFRLGTEAQALFDRLAGRTGKSKKELIGIALRLSQEGWVNKRDAFQKTAESLEIEGATRIPMAIAPRT